jgi:predicted RNA-binding protein
MSDGGAKTWILTGSLDNFRATAEQEFSVIGMKERHRRLADQVAKGDFIIFYVTGVQAFAAIVRVVGDMYEDRARVWPGKPGKPDSYPWRFETKPVVTLDEEEWVPAEILAPRLEHARKWPEEHWHLAFQGQLRTISYKDAVVIERAMRDQTHYQRSA